MASIKKQIRELIDEINRHNYQYHSLDQPLISDEEYDCLFNEPLQLEKEYPNKLLPESPTQRIGSVTSSISKKTNNLIVGDKPGSKLKTAKELKINIIDENQFEKNY